VAVRVSHPLPLLPPGCVLVSPAAAVGLIELLEPGRRQLRYDGITLLPEPLRSTLEALDASAQLKRGEPPTTLVASPPRWLSTSAAAELVGVSRQSVHKAIKAGRVRSDRRGRSVVVSEASVRQWSQDR
jgi:excisionase family DNA binding protein